MLRHIEPQAPLLGGASVHILQNWDSIDCRRIDHLTLFGVQAMELAKNVWTSGHNISTSGTDGHGSNKRGHARAGDDELILRTTQTQSAVMMVACSRI